MSLKLLIVGAGDTGREVLQYAYDCHRAGHSMQVRGFIDIDRNALDGFDLDVKIIGDDSYIPEDNEVYIIAVGDANLREKLAHQITAAGRNLISIIHPSAYVAPSAHIGAGCIIAPLSFVAVNARLADNVFVNVCSVVGHDASLGRHTVISPGAMIGGTSILGDGVFVGSNAVIVPGRTVGAGSKITAGSVLYQDVGAHQMVHGNPAKCGVLIQPKNT